ncbi:MAG: hypothetical protein ABI321_01340 [Polyangia bacterium]
MRIVGIVLLLLFVFGSARADDRVAPVLHADRNALKRAQKIEYTGLALTCLGTTLVLGSTLGMDPFSLGSDNPDASYRMRSDAGTGLLVIGSLAAAAGSVMWIVGGVQAHRAKQVVIAPNGFGARF